MNVAKLLKITGSMDEALFLTSYPAPALVFARDKAPDSLYDSQSDTRDGEVDLATTGRRGIPVLRMQDDQKTPEGVIDVESKVVFIAKSARNPFGEMVVLGRQTRADISIPLPAVSKVHLVFLKEGRDWVVLDQRSKNGTCLNGTELERGRKAFVKDGDVVSIGRAVTAVFRTPEGLYQLLAMLR